MTEADDTNGGPAARTSGGRDRATVQTVAAVVGVVFLVVGIAGFIPGLTTHYDTLSFAGTGSMAMLLGLFMVSVLHNIVHLLFGVAGLLCSRRPHAARLYLIIGGIVYLVLYLYGLLINKSSGANFVPVNSADNWLHLGLAVGMILLGGLFGLDVRRTPRPGTAERA